MLLNGKSASPMERLVDFAFKKGWKLDLLCRFIWMLSLLSGSSFFYIMDRRTEPFGVTRYELLTSSCWALAI